MIDSLKIIFRNRNKKPIEITLKNQTTPNKKSTQFLGAYWQSKSKSKKNNKYYQVVAGKKWGGDWKTLKRLYSAI